MPEHYLPSHSISNYELQRNAPNFAYISLTSGTDAVQIIKAGYYVFEYSNAYGSGHVWVAVGRLWCDTFHSYLARRL